MDWPAVVVSCYSAGMTDDNQPIGRPLKFQSVEELSAKVDAYFAECEREEDTRVFQHGEVFIWKKDEQGHTEERCKECRGEILDKYGLPTTGCILVSGELKVQNRPTISGLALWLDCDKETIREYRGREDFSAPIKNAYLRVEREHELNLHDARVPPAKTIFALSNFGLKNPQHIDHNLNVNRDGAAQLAQGLLGAQNAVAENDPRSDAGTEDGNS